MNVIRRVGKALIELDRSRRFERIPGAYHGVYRSFAEARAAFPARPLGFDSEAMTTLYDDRLERVFSSDYPALFWLRDALEDARRLFDFGGHVGVSYYAYAKYLQLPEPFCWRVCDMPAIARAGVALAQRRAATGLEFCTDFSECSGSDILLAAGSLQYVETPLAQLLESLAQRPKHIILNKLPLRDGEPFVTVQNTMHALNPYRVDDRRALLSSLGALGYEVVDQWENTDLGCYIPRYPEHSVRTYSGMYLRILR